MDPKPYKGKYDPVAKFLHSKGLLPEWPKQVDRTDLRYDEGIDITYTFKGMTPKRFEDLADALMLLAYNEAKRYNEYRWKFAKVVIEVNRTAKGRKSIKPVREYTAGKHEDPDIMVYGEKALGYQLPEEAKSKPFLVNRIQDIIDIIETISPEGTIKRQNPYKVLALVICIRAGIGERSR